MKKIILLLAVLSIVNVVFSQKTLLVYAPKSEVVGENTKKVVVEEFTNNLNKSGCFKLITRNREFNELKEKELIYSNSGNVSDDQRVRDIFGQESGLDYVCMITFKPIDDEYKMIYAAIVETKTGYNLSQSRRAVKVSISKDDIREMQKSINDITNELIKHFSNNNISTSRFDKYDWYSLLESAFVPGVGQITKHRYGHGACILVGELAFVAGGITSYSIAKKELVKMQDPAIPFSDFKKAKKNYSICRATNITSYSLAAALYVGNLFWAFFVQDKNPKHIAVNFQPSIIPADDNIATGFCLTFNF